MSEKLVVSIDGSKEHPDQMMVQDAFAHVLELFQLVNDSDPEAKEQVKWRLVSVSMNSPFTVIAEAVPVHAGVLVESIARRQKTAFHRNCEELSQGRLPSAWSSPRARETVSRFLARNRNGIGATKIEDDESTPIVITAEEAEQAAVTIAAAIAPPKRPKEQIGSIEGVLVQVATHYGQPAIQIQERKTKDEIWCVVPVEFQHQVAKETSVEDVWKGSRVIARGKISYGGDGKISRVEATSVRRVVAQNVLEEKISDKGFTGGLGPEEYLERLWDGSLG